MKEEHIYENPGLDYENPKPIELTPDMVRLINTYENPGLDHENPCGKTTGGIFSNVLKGLKK